VSFGALTFLNPWLLAALATLPLIYWLLRTVPPRPKQIAFPPTRILVGIENREKTPIKTPWWLLLIRLLAAALVILSLAEPVLNPERKETVQGSGPIVAVVDNGWASAPRWQEWSNYLDRLITDAEAQGRAIAIVETASPAKTRAIKIEAPADARSSASTLKPQPFAPDRKAALDALISALRDSGQSSPNIVWLNDGIDYSGDGAAFADGLARLAAGSGFAVVSDAPGREALGLDAGVGADGKLTGRVIRAGGPLRDGVVQAFSARSERLGDAPFKLEAGATVDEITITLPLELRNQVTRIEIAGENSAGSVNLLDQRAQWQRVGILSGESQEKAQPLLAPLYYINKAIVPFAEVIRPKDANLAEGLDAIFKARASLLMLADIGTLSGEVLEKVDAWVKKGGVLVRFAGPRLEKGGDELLPVHLRLGGRTLGGALSWSTPQPLAAFEDSSLFAGLTVPNDVTVQRQVLADLERSTSDFKVWAKLKDGTPLVTAARRGQGQLVLFHVTANSDWSSLPMSGLFVEMLKRITSLGSLGTGSGDAEDATADARAANASIGLLAPLQTLDGFGILKAPPPTAEPIALAKFAEVKASLDHPPGYYGQAGNPRSINAISPAATLAPLPPPPASALRLSFESAAATPLKSWMLAAALALLFADIIAVLLMQLGGFKLSDLRRRVSGARSAAALLFAAGLLAAYPDQSMAQDATNAPPAAAQTDDSVAQRSTAKMTLGYVLTGDETTDTVSRLGLTGLGRVLALRTAVEPGEPAGIDITKDEIAFYPVLYWPVPEDAAPLATAAVAKIDAYMKQGGMIIFDTRDFGKGGMEGYNLAGGGVALQRLVSALDLPRLEPVPENHVLTKSFYLLKRFPGRWDGGELWVEASDEDPGEGERRARRADGVSSILITSNDFASAWALDDRGRPLYPTLGGENQREMAFRAGVNIVMHALTGNYKADQVHVPALLERLGQ
jgi:hypothetical protein